MRLDKFITANSLLSRSQAKAAIRAGQVKVNAQLVKQANLKLQASDQVHYQDQLLTARQPLYLALNKPVGYECSKAPSNHPSIFALLTDEQQEQFNELNPVGRLDVATSGLLLLTTDGQWLHQLTHPSKRISKTYLAELADPLASDAITAFAEGIQLNNEAKPCLPAQLELLNPQLAKITLEEGRYHQVRRMFAALSNRVIRLERLEFASLTLDNLQLAEGEIRSLTDAELEQINQQLNLG